MIGLWSDKRLKQICTKSPLQGQITAMVIASGEILEIPGGGGSGKFLKSKWDVDLKREVLSSHHTGGSCPGQLNKCQCVCPLCRRQQIIRAFIAIESNPKTCTLNLEWDHSVKFQNLTQDWPLKLLF